MRKLSVRGSLSSGCFTIRTDRYTRAKNPSRFYAGQMRLVLKNCGHIDAENIEEYIAVGGYAGLEKVLFEMTKEEGLDMIEEANLRGRGGGGFPAGKKWKQVARQKEKDRYVVCNGDEGDPGAFMDRSIMEGDPHKMLEGMLIAAYAVQVHMNGIHLCTCRVSAGGRASAHRDRTGRRTTD